MEESDHKRGVVLKRPTSRGTAYVRGETTGVGTVRLIFNVRNTIVPRHDPRVPQLWLQKLGYAITTCAPLWKAKYGFYCAIRTGRANSQESRQVHHTITPCSVEHASGDSTPVVVIVPCD